MIRLHAHLLPTTSLSRYPVHSASAGHEPLRVRPVPGGGQTRVLDAIALNALFPHNADALLLRAALEAFDPALDWSRAAFRNVEDQDWERAWMDQYAPLRFGARTWIVPWNHELPAEADAPDAAVVRLDPGLAFGSGTHPTTSLCLQWLDALAARGELQGREVLDFGCGDRKSTRLNSSH